jgi:hypothetical protein
MQTLLDKPARWIPETSAERELVLAELEAIISSYHFRGSKRYPALLQYVVSKTLDGHADELKERTLGVEVFDRQPDYDTNADPVVRFSAGEIRKRIAQYYHEGGADSRMQIDLPLGSYVPEFKPRSPGLEPKLPHEAVAGLQEEIEPKILSWKRSRLEWWLAAVLLLTVFGAYFLHRAPSPTIVDTFWNPLLQSPGPVLILVGTSHPEPLIPESDQTSFLDHMRGSYHHISLSSAIALARLAGVLQRHNRVYEIKEASDASLTDVRSRSVVLVGGMNNLWTMRLIEPMRFRFVTGALRYVQDTANLSNNAWSVDFSKPFPSIDSDYAIVARYHDTTTDGSVMILAGLGPYGTEAASELVASPQYLDQILKKVPSGWENKNLELVIKTDVINGEAGPPYLVSSVTW